MRGSRGCEAVLAELQRAFVRELFGDGERLRPYRDTTLGALAGALAAIHPVCERLVGAEPFRELARRCARERPSRSPDLNDYGELADFVAGFAPARALPYLADVARLEWALHHARHAALGPPLEPARLTADSRIALAPGTSLVASPYPVDRIWETNQPGNASDTEVRLDAGAVQLAVAREPAGAGFSRLESAEFELLRGLARGLPLERAAGAWSGSAGSLGAFLARALERRWL
jgi:hypothetical protein